MQYIAETLNESEMQYSIKLLLQQLRDCSTLESIKASKNICDTKECEMELKSSCLKIENFFKSSTANENTEEGCTDRDLLSLLIASTLTPIMYPDVFLQHLAHKKACE